MNRFFKVKKAAIKKKAGNVEYYVKAYWGEINKDNYEEGEYERVRTFSEKGDGEPFATALDAANDVLATFGFDEIDEEYWSIERDEKGLRFETSVSTDITSSGNYEVVEPNSERYQQFKEGLIDLYVFTFVIIIGKRQEVDFDDSEI